MASNGATPLLVAEGNQHRRRGRARRHPEAGHAGALRAAAQDGPRTVMITGDNPLTAATIAKQAGVDDFVARSHARKPSSPTSARSRPRASWSP